MKVNLESKSEKTPQLYMGTSATEKINFLETNRDPKAVGRHKQSAKSI